MRTTHSANILLGTSPSKCKASRSPGKKRKQSFVSGNIRASTCSTVLVTFCRTLRTHACTRFIFIYDSTHGRGRRSGVYSYMDIVNCTKIIIRTFKCANTAFTKTKFLVHACTHEYICTQLRAQTDTNMHVQRVITSLPEWCDVTT